MNYSRKYFHLARYLLLFGPLMWTLAQSPPATYPAFVAVALILVSNSQIRLALANRSLLIASILGEIALITYLALNHGRTLQFMLFVSLIDCYIRLDREAYPLTVLAGGAYLYLLYRFYQSAAWEPAMFSALVFAVVLLLLLQLRQEFRLRVNTEALYDEIRRSNYELESARTRLLDYSKQVEKTTQLEERNRISRELHDSLGHSLTGVLMQVDAARQIIKTDVSQGLTLLDAAYANINHCIETVRQTVRRLSPAGYRSSIASLEDLTRKFRQTTGINVEFTVSGTPYELYPSAEIAFYRNTQEALTNAVRHGLAHNITVRLDYLPEFTELTVSDDGRGVQEIRQGFGLSGMEERIELIGGSITYTGAPGFTVRMRVPRKELG